MIIAFSGRKYHGKDTASEAIPDSVRINFSDPVKQICQIMFHLTDAEISDPILKQTRLTRWPYKTPRELMQYIGDGIRQDFPDVWLIGWAKRAEKFEGQNIIVTDVRYPNEVELLKQIGAMIIRIYNPRVQDDEFSNHASENQVDGLFCDWQIENGGSIPTLHENVRRAYEWAQAHGGYFAERT